MNNEKRSQEVTSALQKRIRTFSRVEKAFYTALILTAITMSVSIIFLQSRKLQLQQDITALNRKIDDKKQNSIMHDKKLMNYHDVIVLLILLVKVV